MPGDAEFLFIYRYNSVNKTGPREALTAQSGHLKIIFFPPPPPTSLQLRDLPPLFLQQFHHALFPHQMRRSNDHNRILVALQ